MSTTKHLENTARRFLSPSMARAAKRLAVYPRYLLQKHACSRGYRQYGHAYAHPILFIAGLPKSGTTWLERMVSSYPGYHDLLIPDAAAHELAAGGSHDYQLPQDVFRRFANMLVVTKMHVNGSSHNAGLLREAGVPYVVLYRDLRDVAVSYYFYVRQTPWHPEYPTYHQVEPSDALLMFAQRTLVAYADWMRSWAANRDPGSSLMLRYEEMLASPESCLGDVARLFGIDSSPATIGQVVQEHSFRKLAGGRTPGQQSTTSFYRKGIAGDWRNYFTPEAKDVYKRLVGDFLIELGYEHSLDW